MSAMSAVSTVGVGFGLGFAVAVQPGPMSMFLVRTTLRSGRREGLGVAGGVALVDTLYAALGAAGAGALLRLDPMRIGLGLVGAAALVVIGGRTLWASLRVRSGAELAVETATPGRAFVTSAGATASNPATIVYWAAVFAAASVATGASPVLLVVGVGLGSLCWVAGLSLVISVLRRRVSDRAMQMADWVTGVALVGFGAALGWRTLDSA
jgi:putative LysE/RhtB family amino acid efflux pump